MQPCLLKSPTTRTPLLHPFLSPPPPPSKPTHHHHHLSLVSPLPTHHRLTPLYLTRDDLHPPHDDPTPLGDCLVFEEGAFEDPHVFVHPESPAPAVRKTGRGPAPLPEPESLVPEEWREVQAEINLTKKEKRRIVQQMKFGSRLEMRVRRKPSEEEYQAYRSLKLSQLKPVVLDDPLGPLKEPPPSPYATVEGSGVLSRAEPRNPRLGVDGSSLDDIAEFFNKGGYAPGEADDKKPQGNRKLFTMEEKVLLNKRIPNLADATVSKWLPLHTLAASGEFYLLDKLLKHNVDINAPDKDGLTALHKAIICKKQAIMNYLLRESANPFVRDQDGATLMHYAVQTASSDAIKLLLLYNVDINLADNDGWTPLHLAVQSQRTDILRLLLIKGADQTLKNQDGLTPLDLCLHSGQGMRNYELIKQLMEFANST
ncbi:hypothetical protein QJS10_CPA01g00326 [Acorus calamus]|uniref:Ankyrin repeat domain-containing protein, chloroplastic n=1 Tax=Acorus calamus TaxID=4465 RepID=A0AAV9FLY0_ACOCL|nr:hypothetical protein QJS10_CPA01g00326 [Acorus calamus]